MLVRANGPQCLEHSIDACLPMLLHGMDNAEAGVAQAATDILLVG